MKNKKNILVTGGAGLIGSYLVEMLAKNYIDDKIIVIDDFSKGKKQNLSSVQDLIEIREGDLEDEKFSKEALYDCDVLYHLASRAYGIGYSLNNHYKILQHNERITNNIFETLSRKQPEYISVVSSSCVYDDDGPNTTNEIDVFQGQPEKANYGYGWAKRFLEQKAVLFALEKNIPVSICRPFNIYGERYNWVGEYSQAIPMLVKKILDGNNPVHVWGTGNQRRSYMHASDCARLILEISKIKYCKGPVNIGTEETIAVLDLVKMICEITGKNPEIICDVKQPEGRKIKSADMRLFYSLFPDFNLKMELKQGIIKMTDWYRQSFS